MQAASRQCTHPLFGVPTRLLLLFLAYLATVDAYLTQNWLARGLGREVNPAMEWLYEMGGAPVFVLLKVGMTALCLLWIGRRAPVAVARVATLVAFSIYVPITGLHVLNAFGIGMA
jgi:hypothetical protein